MVHFLRQQITLHSIIRSQTTKVERKLARRNFRLIVGDLDEVGTTESSSSGDDMNCKDQTLKTEFPTYFALMKKELKPCIDTANPKSNVELVGDTSVTKK